MYGIWKYTSFHFCFVCDRFWVTTINCNKSIIFLVQYYWNKELNVKENKTFTFIFNHYKPICISLSSYIYIYEATVTQLNSTQHSHIYTVQIQRQHVMYKNVNMKWYSAASQSLPATALTTICNGIHRNQSTYVNNGQTTTNI